MDKFSCVIKKILQELINKLNKSYQHQFNENFEDSILLKFIGGKSLNDDRYYFYIYSLNYEVELILFNIYNQLDNLKHKNSDKYQDQIIQGLKNCDYIIDFLWEDLNTRKWDKVPVLPRQIYAYHQWLSSLLIIAQNLFESKDRILVLIDAIKKIDNGLLMSPDLKDRLLAESSSYLHRILISILEQHADETISCRWKTLMRAVEMNVDKSTINVGHPILNPDYKIKTIDYELDLLDFEEQFFLPKIPVVIRKGIMNWPAMCNNRWTMHYLLRKMAYRVVPVEIGSKYTDENWSQKTMTIAEFVLDYILNDNNGIGYMAQYNLFDQVIDLANDIVYPDYCSIADCSNDVRVDVNAWFGPAGTVSPLHFDAKNNLLAQIMGSKYIRLYSDQTPSEQIYPNASDSLLWNTSQVNIENVDNESFPQFNQIDSKLIFECLLNEGDILFIPKKFWHFVKATSDSFSVNFWWT